MYLVTLILDTYSFIFKSLKPYELSSDTLLLYHHTEATVALVWPEPPFSLQESDLKTSESRAHLFSRLLGHAHMWQQIITLKDLLNKWPQFQDSDFR
jgi:hypothetical protein